MELTAALTFIELNDLLAERGITPVGAAPADFDPPHGGAGALFAVSRGLLQAADLPEDLLDGEVVAADGRANFVEAIREFESGDLDARLLEVLCCHGCISGAGMSTTTPLFRRRARVSEFVRGRQLALDRAAWLADLTAARGLDLTRTYRADDQRIGAPDDDTVRAIMRNMGKNAPGDELNCGACGYATCRAPSSSCARRWMSWPRRTRRWCSRRNWRGSASWPPASRTRSIIRSGSC